MNLPNYFLADLPPDAMLTPAVVGEACETLKRNRRRYLAERPTENLVGVLGAVGESWLRPGNAFRELALELGPAETGFSRPTLVSGLEAFFRQLTTGNLRGLLVQELGDAGRLEAMIGTGETGKSRAALATGPELLVHVVAGNIPNPALTSMVLGLLVRSAQFVKCASGAAFLPRLFAHSIYEADAKLGACLEVAQWRGGNAGLEAALFEHADCVTATGKDETLAAIRAQLPPTTRFLGYGHRVSFGYVTRDVLVGPNARPIVTRVAADVVAWNQLGCLSPHVIYVQSGGEVSPEEFARLLADELEQRESAEPRGALAPEHAANIASRRAVYELRAAHSPETRMWRSADSTSWTVVFEGDPRFQTSCLHRFIYVKGVKDLDEILHNAASARANLSTVGLAASPRDAQALATQLARWGATRVCPVGQMQNPPLAWRHDGRPALGDLVTWTDWEQ